MKPTNPNVLLQLRFYFRIAGSCTSQPILTWYWEILHWLKQARTRIAPYFNSHTEKRGDTLELVFRVHVQSWGVLDAYWNHLLKVLRTEERARGESVGRKGWGCVSHIHSPTFLHILHDYWWGVGWRMRRERTGESKLLLWLSCEWNYQWCLLLMICCHAADCVANM